MKRRTSPRERMSGISAAAPKRGTRRAKRSAWPATKQPAGTEMLCARVDITTARRFRSLAKLRGEKVQALLQTVLAEYLARSLI